MNSLPDGPRGRALAAGILVLIVVAVYMMIVSPLVDLYDARADRLQSRVDLAQRLAISARDLPRLRASAEQLEKDPSKGTVLLTGGSPAVAAAQLQTTVKEIVENSGAHLISSEILAAEAVESFQRVGLHVSFAGDLSLLTSVLRGIETSHPAMFIDNVEIRSSANAGEDSGALAIAFDVYGFRAL